MFFTGPKIFEMYQTRKFTEIVQLKFYLILKFCF